MTPEEVKELISKEVEKRITEEKKLLSRIIDSELMYTGEFAKAHKIIRAISEWANG